MPFSLRRFSVDIKIYKICKFIHDLNTANISEARYSLASLILNELKIETVKDKEDKDKFAFTCGNINEDGYFNSILVMNNPRPSITISVSNMSIMYESKLSIFYIDGICKILSYQTDKYHGYRKELKKEFNWENSVESSQLLDILENGRNQIFISDNILGFLK